MILCDTIDSLIRSFAGYAIEHNLTPFISMQNHYNLVYREEEREMMPVLKHFGVGSIPWSPLARGTVCRPLSQQSQGSGRAAVDQYVHQTLNDLSSHLRSCSMGSAMYFVGAGTPDIINRYDDLIIPYDICLTSNSELKRSLRNMASRWHRWL